MGSKTIIVLGIIATLSIIFIVAVSSGYGQNNYLFQDGSYPFTGNQNASGYYILNFPQETWFHIDYSQGVTDKHIASILPGVHHQDRRFLTLHVSVDIPPGVGKSVTVTISDGTDSLEVLITGDVDLYGEDSSTPFNLDVSVETLTMSYSQTAGGGSTSGCIMLHWYYKEN